MAARRTRPLVLAVVAVALLVLACGVAVAFTGGGSGIAGWMAAPGFAKVLEADYPGFAVAHLEYDPVEGILGIDSLGFIYVVEYQDAAGLRIAGTLHGGMGHGYAYQSWDPVNRFSAGLGLREHERLGADSLDGLASALASDYPDWIVFGPSQHGDWRVGNKDWFLDDVAQGAFPPLGESEEPFRLRLKEWSGGALWGPESLGAVSNVLYYHDTSTHQWRLVDSDLSN